MTASLPMDVRCHGGTDAQGAAPWDFSTNSNAAGPCPGVRERLAAVDPTRYPDPAYAALRARLACFHAVDESRIVIGASGSELIARLTQWACRQARLRAPQGMPTVWLPPHHYVDYARQAALQGALPVDDVRAAALVWLCAPSSPLGQALVLPAHWEARDPNAVVVLDGAYAPLTLTQEEAAPGLDCDAVWQLWTPNKALGLCGLRAAYAVAPRGLQAPALAELVDLAPSWPLGAHGVALLDAWTRDDTQRWLQQARTMLRTWKEAQVAQLEQVGWRVRPSIASFLVARPPWPAGHSPQAVLGALRRCGIKLRDCTSFGLPGEVRLCVHTPEAREALAQAWQNILEDGNP